MLGAPRSRPRPALGVLPSAYTPAATGVFCDSPAPSRSQAGPLDPGGQGRLCEHQPKLKCLSPPRWLCSRPACPSHRPSPSLRAHRAPRGPQMPRGPKRAKERAVCPVLRLTTRVLQVAGAQRPLGHSGCLATVNPPEENGFKMLQRCANEPEHPRRSWCVRPPGSVLKGSPWGMGTWLLDSVALSRNTAPHTGSRKASSRADGPGLARMAFASSQRASPTHTHLQPGDLPLCLGGVATERGGPWDKGGGWHAPRKVPAEPPSSGGQGGRGVHFRFSRAASSARARVLCLRPARWGGRGRASMRPAGCVSGPRPLPRPRPRASWDSHP